SLPTRAALRSFPRHIDDLDTGRLLLKASFGRKQRDMATRFQRLMARHANLFGIRALGARYRLLVALVHNGDAPASDKGVWGTEASTSAGVSTAAGGSG